MAFGNPHPWSMVIPLNGALEGALFEQIKDMFKMGQCMSRKGNKKSDQFSNETKHLGWCGGGAGEVLSGWVLIRA